MNTIPIVSDFQPDLRPLALSMVVNDLGVDYIDLNTPLYVTLGMSREQAIVDGRPCLLRCGRDLPVGIGKIASKNTLKL